MGSRRRSLGTVLLRSPRFPVKAGWRRCARRGSPLETVANRASQVPSGTATSASARWSFPGPSKTWLEPAHLLSTVQGNLYELSQFSGLKLWTEASFGRFRSSVWRAAECRRSEQTTDGTIIKPSIGLTPEQTANLVEGLAEAGIDFIKDDELMADPPHSPFDRRVDAVMRVLNRHADRTGKKVMYAFNLSDELDAMLRHYDKVVASGGTRW
jgi:ribulose-bisphosphate carboxylase large chain